MWHSQRRIKKEEQRLAEVEVAERGEAGREQNGTANMAREQNSPKAAITQFNAAAVVEVWNVDAELEEDRSSWRVKTIKAWVDCVPAGLGPDMADLETQLLRARQYEETWMVRGRRLHRSKVVFADELNLPNRDHISNCIGEGSS